MNYLRFLLPIVFAFFFFNLQAQTVNYISPKPGSVYNNERTNIIIGYESNVKAGTNRLSGIDVRGSMSGKHTGEIIMVSGNRLIFKPDIPFSLGETVTVRRIDGANDFTFSIRKVRIEKVKGIHTDLGLKSNGSGAKDELMLSDSLPISSIYQNGPTTSGYIFLTNFGFGLTPSYLMILKNNGEPYFSRRLSIIGLDFKKQNDNLITYFDGAKAFYLGLDRNYTVVDSFYCGNGYLTDVHELQVMQDGSAWLMSYDPQIVRMDTIVPGGKANALVTGLIIQKIDINKNVIFQWRSWDYVPITDATHEDLTADTIDYIHGNAIEVCPDGNIMISSRHIDEITKINTTSGNIIWRLGGKQNQFTFINDDIGFSHQHSVRVVSDSNIILFDNGNFHTPSFSRAIEYRINEVNKTATLVWQYRHSPDLYAQAMGSVQRLSNGNTVIGWGTAFTTMTEVTPAGEVIYELSLTQGLMSYRAFRFDWGLPEQNTPYSYMLQQNYPNPFNSFTTIKFDIPVSSNASLSVYDITGRRIDRIFDKYLLKGEYIYSWGGSNYSSGVYFYRLITDTFSEVKKMVLIK